MRNLWSDRDAEFCVRRYAKAGVSRDLALRVYTTRLLGGEPRLVTALITERGVCAASAQGLRKLFPKTGA